VKALRSAFADSGEVYLYCFGFPRRDVTSGDGTRALVCRFAGSCFFLYRFKLLRVARR
jgi:hypothetical protein